jgi:hypothetical protein
VRFCERFTFPWGWSRGGMVSKDQPSEPKSKAWPTTTTPQTHVTHIFRQYKGKPVELLSIDTR